MLFLELLKEIFGVGIGAGVKLLQETGPDRCKRVGPGAPDTRRSCWFAMGRTYFAFLPGRPETLQENFCRDPLRWVPPRDSLPL